MENCINSPLHFVHVSDVMCIRATLDTGVEFYIILKLSFAKNPARDKWGRNIELVDSTICRTAAGPEDGVRRRRVPVLQRGITPSQPGEHRDWRLLESREALRLSSNALRLCLEVSN